MYFSLPKNAPTVTVSCSWLHRDFNTVQLHALLRANQGPRACILKQKTLLVATNYAIHAHGTSEVKNTMAGRKSLEAAVSRFVLSTCLLGSHGSLPTCLCLTLVILEGSTDVFACISPMALGDGYRLVFRLCIFGHFAGYFKSF
jgi:hypothetical protein